jgi:hypothetical protein
VPGPGLWIKIILLEPAFQQFTVFPSLHAGFTAAPLFGKFDADLQFGIPMIRF